MRPVAARVAGEGVSRLQRRGLQGASPRKLAPVKGELWAPALSGKREWAGGAKRLESGRPAGPGHLGYAAFSALAFRGERWQGPGQPESEPLKKYFFSRQAHPLTLLRDVVGLGLEGGPGPREGVVGYAGEAPRP
ncbi:MAG: hypothetical protein B7L53_05375 [Thermofilum sp. NZ13]|nr:MAG: hypothetical protein B7L53_05375 [Thermofilum sp. NZ13]